MVFHAGLAITVVLALLKAGQVDQFASWPWPWVVAPVLVGLVVSLALKIVSILLRMALGFILLGLLLWFGYIYMTTH